MTRVNYNAVVEELLKGVVALDSERAMCINSPRYRAIAEFRTIGFRGTRQTGMTHTVRNLALKDNGKTLIVFPDRTLRESFEQRWEQELSGVPKPFIWGGAFYSEQERRGKSPIIGDCNQFDTIIIDEASRYFGLFSYDKTFRAISGVASDNVVVYLAG